MSNSILIKFGLKVQELRIERNLTQEKLAELSGLDRTYISGVERGKRNISLKSIDAIAHALDIPVSQFFLDI